MRSFSLLFVVACSPAAKPDAPSGPASDPATTPATPVPTAPTPPVADDAWEQPFLNKSHCTRIDEAERFEQYDAQGWLVARSSGSSIVTYSYTTDGNERTAHGSDGTTTTYNDRRHVVEQATDGVPERVCSFVYDDATTLAGSGSCSDGSSMTLDACGQPVEITVSSSVFTVESTYREDCVLAQQRYLDSGSEFAVLLYDNLGRLTSDGVVYSWTCNDGSSEATCDDGDDDDDGLADCRDPDCIEDPVCNGPTVIDVTASVAYHAGPDAELFGYTDCTAENTYGLTADPTLSCPGCDEVLCGERTAFTGTSGDLCDGGHELCMGVDYGTGSSWQVYFESDPGVWDTHYTTSSSQGVHTFSEFVDLDSADFQIGSVSFTYTLEER